MGKMEKKRFNLLSVEVKAGKKPGQGKVLIKFQETVTVKEGLAVKNRDEELKLKDFPMHDDFKQAIFEYNKIVAQHFYLDKCDRKDKVACYGVEYKSDAVVLKAKYTVPSGNVVNVKTETIEYLADMYALEAEMKDWQKNLEDEAFAYITRTKIPLTENLFNQPN